MQNDTIENAKSGSEAEKEGKNAEVSAEVGRVTPCAPETAIQPTAESSTTLLQTSSDCPTVHLLPKGEGRDEGEGNVRQPIVSTLPIPNSALRTPHSAIAPDCLTLRSYQSAVFCDHQSGILILHWARQTGKSYTLAAWAVYRLMRHPGRLVTVLSNSRDNGAEFLRKCAEICRLFRQDDRAQTVIGKPDKRDFEDYRMELRLRYAGEVGRIKVLAASPRTARGFSGDLILDEFAFHEDSAAIWSAAEPILASNPDFRCRIASTGNGHHNMFHRMVTSAQPHKSMELLQVGRVTPCAPEAAEDNTTGINSPNKAATVAPRPAKDERGEGQGEGFLNSPQSEIRNQQSEIPKKYLYFTPDGRPDYQRRAEAEYNDHKRRRKVIDVSHVPEGANITEYLAQEAAAKEAAKIPRRIPIPPLSSILHPPSSIRLSRLTRTDAHRLGLQIYDPGTRQPITPAQARSQALDKRAYDQNYECTFADENITLLTHELISAAERYDVGYICEQNWSLDALELLRTSNNPLYVGFDVARKGDLSVITVIELICGAFFVRAVLRIRDMRLPEQEFLLGEICQMPQFKRAAIDMTGLGCGLCEYAQNHFDRYRIQGINFAATVPANKETAAEGRVTEKIRITEAMAIQLLRVYEDRRIQHPRDDILHDDLRKPEKITSPGGRVSIAATRDEAGHADHFWSFALAIEAGSQQPSNGCAMEVIERPPRTFLT